MSRLVPLLLTAALVAAGCGLSPPAESAPPSVGSTADRAAITSTTTTAPPSTVPVTTTTTIPGVPPLDHDEEARALITSAGIVVPVLETVIGGWRVRTPCRNEAVLLAGTPIDRVHVVVDAGHGGAAEPGAVGENGLVESPLNLEVALLIEELLEAGGYEVLLTRYSDYRLPIITRAEIANTLDADLMVSIHHNAGTAGPSEVPGSEVYYARDSVEGKRLAGLIREEAVARLGQFDADWVAGPDGEPDEGVTYRLDAQTGDDFYGMVRRPTIPAVITEMSYLGNPTEAALLETPGYRRAEAEAVVAGIVRWYETEDPGSGFVEPSYQIDSSGGGGGTTGCVDPELG
ncbi:MAG: N-acetylmuramoyl-L-alanine amidase [Actinomycetia bacterium]|nr:N-acetylmuramoyl-L-alanine amidase [Actinomycetes bacterium]